MQAVVAIVDHAVEHFLQAHGILHGNDTRPPSGTDAAAALPQSTAHQSSQHGQQGRQLGLMRPAVSDKPEGRRPSSSSSSSSSRHGRSSSSGRAESVRGSSRRSISPDLRKTSGSKRPTDELTQSTTTVNTVGNGPVPSVVAGVSSNVYKPPPPPSPHAVDSELDIIPENIIDENIIMSPSESSDDSECTFSATGSTHVASDIATSSSSGQSAVAIAGASTNQSSTQTVAAAAAAAVSAASARSAQTEISVLHQSARAVRYVGGQQPTGTDCTSSSDTVAFGRAGQTAGTRPQPSADDHYASRRVVGGRGGDCALRLPSRAIAQETHRSTAYSVADVFHGWQNPVLKRQAVRQPHQASRDLSGTEVGDTSRQVGGGEHVPIATFDIGAAASAKRRRSEMDSGRGQPQQRASGGGVVDTKRVAADVKLTCASLEKLRVCGQFDCRVIVCTLDEHQPESESESDSLLSELEQQPEGSVGIAAAIPPAARPKRQRQRLLVAIDQHAADERVQLERLTASVYGQAGDQRNFETVPCGDLWAFDTHEHPQLLEHAETLKSWGFSYTLPQQQQQKTAATTTWREQTEPGGMHLPTKAGATTGLVQMHTVPRVAGVTLAQMHLRKMLSQLHAADMSGSGSAGRRLAAGPSLDRFKPTAVSEILAYRACHSAVRFGDQLTHDECRRIVSQLARCRLPFQCAHGRPTLHPVMAL
jgi:DNA mismatch repair ATPase MutL